MTRISAGGLVAAVEGALGDDTARDAPTAKLALLYAARIDEASHLPLTLDRALRTIRGDLESADALDALDKVSAALSAVTVASDLGPKLLAALDALLLTPKAQAAGAGRPESPAASPPANPLQALRDQLTERRDRRTAH